MEHGQNLSDDQQGMTVHPVDPNTCKRGEKKSWSQSDKTIYAEKKRGRSEMINQPERRRLGHPISDEGDALTDKKEFKITR